MRFCRGMTILKRQQLRQLVLRREVSYAHRRAAVWKLSAACREAMDVMNSDPAMARELHASCKAEEYGGPGCLCLCHDTVTGGVSAGSLA